MVDWARAQSSGAVEEILDQENRRMADSLASKVTRLKSLALDIDRDTEDQNRYLDGMGSDFMSMTGLLTGSVKRFSTMARSGRDNQKLLWGMAGGLIMVFFILSYREQGHEPVELALWVPQATRISCPVSGCRGPATKYCFEVMTAA
ncbi:BET1-like protein [Myotis brandtii]|uniref:BET1-like protein n=1 Tax=Myotis brandtii TaxID=109478 RepID=S7NJY6_MYOBR|nr:PREDICTED: BET1-like protein [Myotis brandtii]EPQ17751.1 BET1-like protein [Myotis brandtii]